MSPLTQDLTDLLEPLLGHPVRLHVLKDKPGRRRTSAAHGPRGSAVVKVYASARASLVASRLAALAHPDAGAAVPPLLLSDPARHAVVIGELAGRPLSRCLDEEGPAAAERAGAALARWHLAHRGTADDSLRGWTVTDELAVVTAAAARRPALEARVLAALPPLGSAWEPVTVVHRDLYEEQILLGPGTVSLVDLDDAARGPAELDVGNVLAHLTLRRVRGAAGGEGAALLHGYRSVAALDPARLHQCTRLASLRLACLHDETAMLAVSGPSPDSDPHPERTGAP